MMVARVKRIQKAQSELKEFYKFGEKIPCVHNLEKIEDRKHQEKQQPTMCFE